MQLHQPSPSYLFRYSTDSGSWESTMLDDRVSLPSVEAMNAICEADGILAFTGQKSKFGEFLLKQRDTIEVDSTRSWISLPEATLLATLGLCRSMSTTGSLKLDFYGSPRTLALAWTIWETQLGNLDAVMHRVCNNILNEDFIHTIGKGPNVGGAKSSIITTLTELKQLYVDYCVWYHYHGDHEAHKPWPDVVSVTTLPKPVLWESLPQCS